MRSHHRQRGEMRGLGRTPTSIFAQNGESRNRVKRVNLSKFTLLANLLLLLFQHIKNSGDYIFRCFQQSFVIMSRVL